MVRSFIRNQHANIFMMPNEVALILIWWLYIKKSACSSIIFYFHFLIKQMRPSCECSIIIMIKCWAILFLRAMRIRGTHTHNLCILLGDSCIVISHSCSTICTRKNEICSVKWARIRFAMYRIRRMKKKTHIETWIEHFFYFNQCVRVCKTHTMRIP